MVHLQAMQAELTDKLKVLVSEHKKDDSATARMLALNIQAEAAAQASLKCGCLPVCPPRDPSAPPTRTGAEGAALHVVLPALAGGAVVTAVQPAVQPAAVQPSAALSVVPQEGKLHWVQCDDCKKWRKLAQGVSAWDGEFKCTINDWNPGSGRDARQRKTGIQR
jgi:hypothetical protein